MLQNLLLRLAFVGSAYHGWQVQHNAVTVQQVLAEAICRATGEKTRLHGCSRTDSGVHARAYYANFQSNTSIPLHKIPAALNYYLPEDIAVASCTAVPPEFHARYSAKGKTYEYRFYTDTIRNPFLKDRAYRFPYAFDEAVFTKDAKAFLGTHDFSAFCAAGSDVLDHKRSVTQSDLRRDGAEWVYTVSADGFLYNMVRIMVGTLLAAASGSTAIQPGGIPDILASRERGKAGPTAPPEGLYLCKVQYP
ncbi:MAG: tRNA pseudouridine(38-40) synthase TruA [Oscillospiraceae bacterium]|jgi:tRNA pseudouridine38-40 synthase|nr:tRNA pseudouridine(38-40) synthase TruA [Oscillospiraceae bacterium]